MADRLPYYFLINYYRSFPSVLHSIAQQINKVPPRIIQLSMNKSGGTIFYFEVNKDNLFALTNNQY